MKLPFWGLIALVLFSGCKDDPEPIPAYVHIEPFSVNELGGAGWQKITEGWLYVNNELIGGYTLPATVPVLAEGQSQIEIFPGVKENGLKQTPSVYPYLVSYQTTSNLSPSQTTNIQPVTQYGPNTVFPWSVDRATFDNSSIVLENRDGDTSNTYILTTQGAFEGRSVLLAVDTAHTIMEVATEEVSDLPVTNAQPVWLEMHYRNDVPFELWVLGSQGNSNETARAVYQFAPSETWNKIYFNLTDYLIALSQDRYRLFFRVGLPRDGSGQALQNTGAVFIDNLRLVHN